MADWIWTAGVAGNWFDVANWTPNGIPQPGDTVTVVSGTPTVDHGTLTAEHIRLGGGPVTLVLNSAKLERGTNGNLDMFIVGGDHDLPASVTLLSHGTTTFAGDLLVEGIGGGSLTIDAANDGATSRFIFEDTAFVLVNQESLLTFAGEEIVNAGVIHVEGVATIGATVAFSGAGMIELDVGGELVVEGAVGHGQRVVFADGTGELTLDDSSLFQGKIGLTGIGGDRIHLEDVRVRSASVDDGMLTLYSAKNQTGTVEGKFAVELVNPADLDALSNDQQDLTARDFRFGKDGEGGTIVTYAPRGPTFLEGSLPTAVVAPIGSEVSLKTIFKQSFGTGHPDFYGITLLPGTSVDGAEGFWGQPSVNGIGPVESGWRVNGEMITKATTIEAGDKVKFVVGNNIAMPPEIQVQVTPEGRGPHAEYVNYFVWTVDPAVAALVQGTGYLHGKPEPLNIVDAAESYQSVYGNVLNSNLCNWIADNVAAAADAPMPLPDAFLDSSINVEGGFWRIAYRSSDTPNPVFDWNTLVQPGDVVRLEWATGSGHTTTVLGVNANGTIEVFDNIDMIGGVHTIGIHDEVAYWKKTDPAGITIYRLDPDHKYLTDGTKLDEYMPGSVFDDLAHGRQGNDTLRGAIGNDALWAGPGDDIVRGGAGADTLIGGLGADTLSGGKGFNVFDYNTLGDSRPGAGHQDLITAFVHGADRIDLAGIDRKLGEALHFIGNDPFSHRPGELNYLKYAHSVVLRADTDGDGRADFAIKIDGIARLGAGDLIL